MNRNDLKNPLIQSGAILLIVFLLISIVANSEPEGFLGSVAGLASGLLFLIGLFVAIIISIAIIIGLFLAAVSFHSVDKARDLADQLKQTVTGIYTRVRGASGTPSPQKHPATAGNATTDAPGSDRLAHLREALNACTAQLTEQRHAIAALDEQVRTIQQDLAGIKQTTNADQADALAQTTQDLNARLEALATTVETSKEQLAALAEDVARDREKTTAELELLHEKTSIPDIVAGILSYVDEPEDRELITSKAEEAVSRGMTYAQIDEFFQSSLRPELFAILESHPRLTKDFIRSVKKKFE